MKKFLVIYYSSVSSLEQMKNSTPEQRKASMDMWMQWAAKAGSAIVDLGAPLGATASFGTASSRVGATSMGGFSFLQAESAEALGKVLEGHPHFHAPDATIAVHECVQMQGM